MNTILSGAELKDKAKEKLSGHYGFLIGISFLSGLLSYLCSMMITVLFSSDTLAGFILSEGVSFIISVFVGVLSVGLTYVYLKTACGVPCRVSDLFYGYSQKLNVSLGISLIRNLLSLIPSLAYIIPLTMFQMTGQFTWLYLVPVCLVVSMIVYLPLYLMLSQVMFILLDFPDKSVSEILTFSIRIMQGNKKRLLLLIFSFIPISLLATVSIIGVLWVIPYVNMTYTIFYLNIMQQRPAE
ncbi:MAG: DUF975 family protein [Lachnospiraceae bacterium]